MTKAKHILPPREKSLGPTLEAMRHGDYVVPDARGSVRVYTNMGGTMLGVLCRNKAITTTQCAAGLCFQETYTAVWGSPSRRDSTQPVVGGIAHETEAQAERMALRRARLHTILNRVGPKVYTLLMNVAVFDMSIGRLRPERPNSKPMQRLSMLRGSLDECAIVYGVDDAAEPA